MTNANPMGRSDNPPQKHHYIPEFWIKRWEGQDGKVQRYTMPIAGKIVSRRKPPAAVGWSKSLYDIPDFNNKAVNFEIRFFRSVDQRASDLFDKIERESRPLLDKNQSVSLSIFLISLLHRSPSALLGLRESTKIVVGRLLDDLEHKYLDVRSAGDPETFQEMYAIYDDHKKLQYLSKVFATLMLSGSLSKFLSELHWFKLDLRVSRYPLLLSDDPMIRTNGIARLDGHLAFPINPHLVLIGVYDRAFINQITAENPTKLVKLMNAQTVESAREFVVSLDERQGNFISNRFGRNLRPTLVEQTFLNDEDRPKPRQAINPFL